MKQKTIFIILLLFAFSATCQVEINGDLFSSIKASDSLLFDIGFNTCNSDVLEKLISEKFTFYHDQSGVSESKKEFIESVQSGLCQLPYKALRELDDNTLSIYPLKKNDTIYGAIQSGEHRFYAVESNNQKYLTSIAKFTHVWIIENENWRLQSVLSYDHKDIVKKNRENGLFIDNLITNEWLEQKSIPSVAIGFIENEQIVQTSVFGKSEKGKNAPLNTIWNVASLTKPITALVALKFVDKGLLNLEEPVFKYFVEEDIKDDPRYKKLTLRIILSHQTGLPNWRGENKEGKLKFEFEPGEKYQYSGEGYDILRKTLESKFDKSIQQLAEELIFAPLKMTSTSFVWTEEIDKKPIAKWYNPNGELYELDKFYKANGADNLLTTIEDYSKFVLYILQGAELSDELQKELVADQLRVSSLKHFGLGWWIDENINENNDYALVHGGDDIGVHCIAFVLPNSKKGLVIFTNCDNGTDAYMEIVNHYLEKDAKGIFNAEMN